MEISSSAVVALSTLLSTKNKSDVDVLIADTLFVFNVFSVDELVSTDASFNVDVFELFKVECKEWRVKVDSL